MQFSHHSMLHHNIKDEHVLSHHLRYVVKICCTNVYQYDCTYTYLKPKPMQIKYKFEVY